jgi:hypothetical protein
MKFTLPVIKTSEEQLSPAKTPGFKLPPMDHILDLCKSRTDFPQHLIEQNGKRRRSLVHDFLLSEEDESHKRQRTLSVDQKDGYQVFSWYQEDPKPALTSRRRYSMFETGASLNQLGYRKGTIRPWTVEEDNKLLLAVIVFGSNWTRIADELPERNRRQCKEHWFRVLSKRSCASDINLAVIPSEAQETPLAAIKSEVQQIPANQNEESSRRGLWSEDEDKQLLRAYNELGPRWPAIAAKVHGRNQRQCEKRFRRMKKTNQEKTFQQGTLPIMRERSNSLHALAALAPLPTGLPLKV